MIKDYFQIHAQKLFELNKTNNLDESIPKFENKNEQEKIIKEEVIKKTNFTPTKKDTLPNHNLAEHITEKPEVTNKTKNVKHILTEQIKTEQGKPEEIKIKKSKTPLQETITEKEKTVTNDNLNFKPIIEEPIKIKDSIPDLQETVSKEYRNLSKSKPIDRKEPSIDSHHNIQSTSKEKSKPDYLTYALMTTTILSALYIFDLTPIGNFLNKLEDYLFKDTKNSVEVISKKQYLEMEKELNEARKYILNNEYLMKLQQDLTYKQIDSSNVSLELDSILRKESELKLIEENCELDLIIAKEEEAKKQQELKEAKKIKHNSKINKTKNKQTHPDKDITRIYNEYLFKTVKSINNIEKENHSNNFKSYYYEKDLKEVISNIALVFINNSSTNQHYYYVELEYNGEINYIDAKNIRQKYDKKSKYNENFLNSESYDRLINSIIDKYGSAEEKKYRFISKNLLKRLCNSEKCLQNVVSESFFESVINKKTNSDLTQYDSRGRLIKKTFKKDTDGDGIQELIEHLWSYNNNGLLQGESIIKKQSGKLKFRSEKKNYYANKNLSRSEEIITKFNDNEDPEEINNLTKDSNGKLTRRHYQKMNYGISVFGLNTLQSKQNFKDYDGDGIWNEEYTEKRKVWKRIW